MNWLTDLMQVVRTFSFPYSVRAFGAQLPPPPPPPLCEPWLRHWSMLQIVNSFLQTCWQLGTSSENTTCWQTCYKMWGFCSKSREHACPLKTKLASSRNSWVLLQLQTSWKTKNKLRAVSSEGLTSWKLVLASWHNWRQPKLHHTRKPTNCQFFAA
jgi:hypothetical protein